MSMTAVLASLRAVASSLDVDATSDKEAEEVVAAWVLSVVLARFADDHKLTARPDVEVPRGGVAWVQARMRSIAEALPESSALSVMRNPVFRQQIPEEFVARLTEALPSGGASDPRQKPDVRWLGDFYAELSPSLRLRYALIQTPGFISEFIVEQTLTPAIDLFGLDGLKIIDPVCGSGSFLLSAFHRVLAESRRRSPGGNDSDLVRTALRSLHGVDKVWHAAAITEFRLLMAAMNAIGCPTLDKARELALPMNVQVGDSLLRSELEGQFHVVVGNPPYLTVADPALDAIYRQRFDVCIGRYPLSVPYAQQFFRLARNGDDKTAGFIGQLTSAAFMKREFGRPLIETFFASQVALSQIVDTSGAFIPGHGVPTVILFGRNHPPNSGDPVRLIVGNRGEPAMPTAPESGYVWRSIVRNVAGTGPADEWTEARDVPRTQLATFPWRLTDDASAHTLERIGAAPARLGHLTQGVGYVAATGADDVFTARAATFRQSRIAIGPPLSQVVTGSDIRDWTVTPTAWAIVPRERDGEPIAADAHPEVFRYLWPYKTLLSHRRNFSGRSYSEDGRIWYDWHQLADAKLQHPNLICYAWVSTHNHFALVPAGVIPLQSAPVIEISEDAGGRIDSLLAVLNSSTTCFWLKQSSNSKGRPAETQTGSGEPWDTFYEFTATRLKDLPLPSTLDIPLAVNMRQLSHDLAEATPTATLNSYGPDRSALEAAKHQWRHIRGAMVAAQEELDWTIYSLFKLGDISPLAASPNVLPQIETGERAFEILMARHVEQGTLETTWFVRHGITPRTDLPGEWPDAYRAIVEQRIEVIESDQTIRALEQPENKRRWQAASWDQMLDAALRTWLLDRLGSAELWYEEPGVPCPRTAAQLAVMLCDAADVSSAASLLAPDRPIESVVAELLNAEQVPIAAASRLRPSGMAKYHAWEAAWQFQDDPASIGEPPNVPIYTAADFLKQSYWRLRGKADRSAERFLTFPHDSTDPLFGWAGWTHSDRVHVLVGLAEHETDRRTDRALPLLAALREQLPWLRRFDPDNQLIPDTEAFYQRALQRLDYTEERVASWMPEGPRRGRPRKAT